MTTEIEIINGDNWRPGTPEHGYIVRYGLWEYGWKYRKCFASQTEAEAFAQQKQNETQVGVH